MCTGVPGRKDCDHLGNMFVELNIVPQGQVLGQAEATALAAVEQLYHVPVSEQEEHVRGLQLNGNDVKVSHDGVWLMPAVSRHLGQLRQSKRTKAQGQARASS